MNQITTDLIPDHSALDRDLDALVAAKDTWARTTNAERIAVLEEIKDRLLAVAEGWAETAARCRRRCARSVRSSPPTAVSLISRYPAPSPRRSSGWRRI